MQTIFPDRVISKVQGVSVPARSGKPRCATPHADPIRLLSTASFVECSIVVAARRGAEGVRDLDHLLARAAIRLEAVDDEQAYLARAAWERFGKGRHAAALKYGDCFAYALAHVTNEPLLFAGLDFAQTDVPIHPASG